MCSVVVAGVQHYLEPCVVPNPSIHICNHTHFKVFALALALNEHGLWLAVSYVDELNVWLQLPYQRHSANPTANSLSLHVMTDGRTAGKNIHKSRRKARKTEHLIFTILHFHQYVVQCSCNRFCRRGRRFSHRDLGSRKHLRPVRCEWNDCGTV